MISCNLSLAPDDIQVLTQVAEAEKEEGRAANTSSVARMLMRLGHAAWLQSGKKEKSTEKRSRKIAR